MLLKRKVIEGSRIIHTNIDGDMYGPDIIFHYKSTSFDSRLDFNINGYEIISGKRKQYYLQRILFGISYYGVYYNNGMYFNTDRPLSEIGYDDDDD